MTTNDPDQSAEAIAEGTRATCRLLGGERLVGGAPNRTVEYRLRFEVIDGPFAGRHARRTLWDSPTGREQLRKDVQRLGVTDPDELCRLPLPEIVLTAGLKSETDGHGKTHAVVWWFDPPMTGHEERAQAESEPEVNTDAAF